MPVNNSTVQGSDIYKAEEIHLSLMDNALDFLLSASEAAARPPTQRNLKDAVLHISNGVELLIKSRLAREHWSLIFADINKANREKLSKGEFTSVDFSRALARLKQIVGVSVDEHTDKLLLTLRYRRNQLTHFTASIELEQVKSLLAAPMNFCVEFCEQQNMVTPGSECKLGKIHTNLATLKEFVDSRMASISESLKCYSTILECPECWQEALGVDGGSADCKFCRYKPEAQDLAYRLSEGRIEDCPECFVEQTFIFVYGNNGDGEWCCCFCGVSGSYDYCARCEQITHSTDADDISFCEVCTEQFMRS